MSTAPVPPAGAIEAWVLASLPRAVAFARSLVRDVTLAEDLVQECYCRLLRKAGEYDLPRDGTKLLFTALTRACIDHQRRQRGESLDGLEGGLVDGRAANPEVLASQRELLAALEVEMANLPTLQRAALELKGLGYSQREIAATLEVSENHVGVLIHRARQTLTLRLQPFRDEVPQ